MKSRCKWILVFCVLCFWNCFVIADEYGGGRTGMEYGKRME
ncbi:MAG: hypothetical protein ACYTE8_13800 [Planctomycetota bacterium]